MNQADLTLGVHHPPGMTVGLPPFVAPAKKMAIWLFIIADAATFAACLVPYGFLATGPPTGLAPFIAL